MSLEFRDLGLGRTLVDYTEAWELQRQVPRKPRPLLRPTWVLQVVGP